MIGQNCDNCNMTDLFATSANESLGKQCLTHFGSGLFNKFLHMFYILFPSENTFESPEEVPNYEVNVSISDLKKKIDFDWPNFDVFSYIFVS